MAKLRAHLDTPALLTLASASSQVVEAPATQLLSDPRHLHVTPPPICSQDLVVVIGNPRLPETTRIPTPWLVTALVAQTARWAVPSQK